MSKLGSRLFIASVYIGCALMIWSLWRNYLYGEPLGLVTTIGLTLGVTLIAL